MHTSQLMKMRTRIFGFWGAGTAEFFENNVFEGGTVCCGGDETPWKLFGRNSFLYDSLPVIPGIYFMNQGTWYLVPPGTGTKLIKNENSKYHSSCTTGTCHNLLNFACNVGLTESPTPVHRYSN